MSQLISSQAGNVGTDFDTKIPQLADTANIVEAFKLYHYGLDNYNGDTSPSEDSVYSHLSTLSDRIDSLESDPGVSLTGTANEVSVAGASGSYTIGLPDDVTIGDDLTVVGDASVGGNMVVAGNFIVSGSTTYVNVQDLKVTDPLIYIGESASANIVDLGLVGSFNDGTYQHTGIVRDASDGKWKLFSNVISEPTTVIDFSGAEYDTLVVGGLETEGLIVTGTSDIRYKTNSQSTAYTLVLADTGKIVEMNVGSGNNLTVPLNSSVPFPVGSQITIIQTGSGQTTLVGTGGVTLNGSPGLKLRAQWSSATLIKRATDTWVAVGDLVA